MLCGCGHDDEKSLLESRYLSGLKFKTVVLPISLLLSVTAVHPVFYIKIFNFCTIEFLNTCTQFVELLKTII